MKASVIIPNFNGKHLLAVNLPLVVAAMENKVNEIGEIIVVDDGSKDESVKFIKENYPKITLIKHTKNRGYSAAVNTGARAAKGELLVLLNSDVAPGAGFLKTVNKHFENPKVFAVSMHEKGYGWARARFVGGYVNLAMGQESDKTSRSFYVSGGSGVFRRSTWMKLGGMDEKLFSPFYWEDIDICYRAAKRGYQLLWEPDSMVAHNHESTVKTLPKKYVAGIRERNQLLFIWKNISSKNLFGKHMISLFKRFASHPGYILIIIMSLGKLAAVIKARKKEKKESKVSDEAIFARF